MLPATLDPPQTLIERTDGAFRVVKLSAQTVAFTLHAVEALFEAADLFIPRPLLCCRPLHALQFPQTPLLVVALKHRSLQPPMEQVDRVHDPVFVDFIRDLAPLIIDRIIWRIDRRLIGFSAPAGSFEQRCQFSGFERGEQRPLAVAHPQPGLFVIPVAVNRQHTLAGLIDEFISRRRDGHVTRGDHRGSEARPEQRRSERARQSHTPVEFHGHVEFLHLQPATGERS